jgi:hypothetical protein
MTTSDGNLPAKPTRCTFTPLSAVPSPASSKVISIVKRTHRCEETIGYLRDLLEQAEAGEVYGLAVAAMLKQRKYVTHTTGEASRNPTFTRGMLTVLDDELANQIAGR